MTLPLISAFAHTTVYDGLSLVEVATFSLAEARPLVDILFSVSLALGFGVSLSTIFYN